MRCCSAAGRLPIRGSAAPSGAAPVSESCSRVSVKSALSDGVASEMIDNEEDERARLGHRIEGGGGLEVGERQVGGGAPGQAAPGGGVVGDGDVAVERALVGGALLTPALDLVHEAHMDLLPLCHRR